MNDTRRKKPRAPFTRATSARELVSAHRAVALPTAALVQLLLAGCGRRVDVDIHRDDHAKTSTVASTEATTSATASAQTKAEPTMGGAPEIEQTIVLTPPPAPPPPPKPVLGKPHNIKPPITPQPLGGDLMMVIPRPLGNGAKPV